MTVLALTLITGVLLGVIEGVEIYADAHKEHFSTVYRRCHIIGWILRIIFAVSAACLIRFLAFYE